MSFPKYEHYKDSGVEWLGEVPAHWDILPLKRVSPSQTVGIVVNPSEYVSDDGLPFIYGGDISEGKICYENSRRISQVDSERNRKTKLSTGDVLVVRVGAPGVAAVVPSECEGGNCASVMLIRKGNYCSNWLCYLFNSRVVRYQVEVVQYGAAQEQFNIAHAVEFKIPTPSFYEQKKIAGYLHQETTKLDALIAEQRTLIDLLKEKCQAVISHAVTKGLDPRVPMKDSGVEWLGEVPAHWSVGAIGYKATVDSGSTPDRGNPDYWNGDIPWIKTGEINYVPIIETEESITAAGLAGSSARRAQPGALLMAMYGQGATRGRVAVLAISAAYNQACAAISFASDMQVHFAKYFFMAAYSHIRDDGNETSQMNLGTGVIRKMKITIPPISEQGDIVSKLDREIELLENLTAEAQTTIALLQERRSALISAAVTGKIDVRQAA